MTFHEPLAVALLGLVLYPVVGSLSFAFWAVSLLLSLKRQIYRWQVRAQVLDQVDRQIEGEVMADLVERRRSPWQTEGFIVPPTAVGLLTGAEDTAVSGIRQRLASRFPGVVAKPDEAPPGENGRAGATPSA